jgi:hypothetical protein
MEELGLDKLPVERVFDAFDTGRNKTCCISRLGPCLSNWFLCTVQTAMEQLILKSFCVD